MNLNEGDKDYDLEAFRNDPKWKKSINNFDGIEWAYLIYLKEKRKTRRDIIKRLMETEQTRMFKLHGRLRAERRKEKEEARKQSNLKQRRLFKRK